MANKKLFNTKQAAQFRNVPVATTVNEAGGLAYKMEDRHALAQLVSTGCLSNTFYASGEEQLEQIISLAEKCHPKFVAQAAIYARKRGLMKEAPSALIAYLFSKAKTDVVAKNVLPVAFREVIDNMKMLSNFVQIIRSGRFGRQSFGTFGKRLIQNFLTNRYDDKLFKESAGFDPSLSDIIKMVHPKATSETRNALYAYITGKPYDASKLPSLVKEYETFKSGLPGDRGRAPAVDFRQLTSLNLSDDEWANIAADAPWQMTRMNLNTFQRHNVLDEKKYPGMVEIIANRLENKDLIAKAKVFPYQLFMAYKSIDANMPPRLNIALQNALETAVDNVPTFLGRTAILVDTSGSMSCPVTGNRGYGTPASQMRCVDVASLIASAILRKNPNAVIIPFDTKVHPSRWNPLSTIVDNAEKLAKYGGGGTACGVAMQYLVHNKELHDVDNIIMVSDNMSWSDFYQGNYYSGLAGNHGTLFAQAFTAFKKVNPRAKLMLIDLQPYASTQMPDTKDVLNVGGFSDAVFDMLQSFIESGANPTHWVSEIEKIVV